MGKNALEIIEDVTSTQNLYNFPADISATTERCFRSVVHLEVTAQKKVFLQFDKKDG
jgi:hypothetical protein